MMYPLVLDLAADKIPVAVTCWVLGFSTQAFYAWRALGPTAPPPFRVGGRVLGLHLRSDG